MEKLFSPSPERKTASTLCRLLETEGVQLNMPRYYYVASTLEALLEKWMGENAQLKGQILEFIENNAE